MHGSRATGRFDHVTITATPGTAFSSGFESTISDCVIQGSQYALSLSSTFVHDCELSDNCYGIVMGLRSTISHNRIRYYPTTPLCTGIWVVTGDNAISDNDFNNYNKDLDLAGSGGRNIVVRNNFASCATAILANNSKAASDYMPISVVDATDTNFIHGAPFTVC